MKHYIFTLLIVFCVCSLIQAQKTDKKVFKEAKVIRLYVTHSSKAEALKSFAKFINKTGFTAIIPEETKDTEQKPKEQSNSLIKPGIVSLKQAEGSSQVGDTIKTNMTTLYDVMWGDYFGRLKFYPAKDEKGNIYITLTGYVSNINFGGNFTNLQMQKGGNANWAQKALFRQISKYIVDYTNLTGILYSDE
nr:hypothetical protein [uncultured Carboxylicivirga sp.]